jgi:hypothetical protein
MIFWRMASLLAGRAPAPPKPVLDNRLLAGACHKKRSLRSIVPRWALRLAPWIYPTSQPVGRPVQSQKTGMQARSDCDPSQAADTSSSPLRR